MTPPAEGFVAVLLQAADPIGGGLLNMLPLFGIMFLVMYLLVLRPQRRQQQARAAMLSAMKKGDTVWTSAGIIGVVKDLTEGLVTLQIDKKADARLRVFRSTIAGVARSDEDLPMNFEAAPGAGTSAVPTRAIATTAPAPANGSAT